MEALFPPKFVLYSLFLKFHSKPLIVSFIFVFAKPASISVDGFRVSLYFTHYCWQLSNTIKSQDGMYRSFGGTEQIESPRSGLQMYLCSFHAEEDVLVVYWLDHGPSDSQLT